MAVASGASERQWVRIFSTSDALLANRWHDGAMPKRSTEARLCDHVWSVEELCDLLPENHKIGVDTDRAALILKALG